MDTVDLAGVGVVYERSMYAYGAAASIPSDQLTTVA